MLGEWNIWHCYSTFLKGVIPDLGDLVPRLVESGAVTAAFHRDGRCWFKVKGEPCQGNLELVFRENRAESLASLPAGLGAFEQECALQSIAMQTHEQFALPDSRSRLPDYARLFLDECVLRFGGTDVALYPVVKLYADGTCLIQLRVVGGDEPFEVDAFVAEHVNLFARDVEGAELPIDLVVGAATHGQVAHGVDLVGSVSRYRERLRERLREGAYERRSGDFKWNSLSANGEMWQLLGAGGLAPSNLCALSNIIKWAILDAANAGQFGPFRRSVIRSQTRLGDYWTGRPVVYVASLDPHPSNYDELLKHHRRLVEKIMARCTEDFDFDFDELAGENLRHFNDYAFFLNESVYLFLGLDRSLFPPTGAVGDAEIDVEQNLGDFVHTKHVLVEFAEYWRTRHHALAEAATDGLSPVSRLMQMRAEIVQLDRLADEVPVSSDVATIVRRAGQASKIESLQRQISANLDVGIAVRQEIRERREVAFGILLAVLLGLSGVPALAEGFVRPAWEHLSWPRPTGDALWELLSFAVTAVLLLLAIGGAWWTVRGRMRS